MQTIAEVMTRDVATISPRENLQRAAQLMDELNVGALPVCDDGKLSGMITDRDIVVRAVAAGRLPQDTRVEEAMSGDVRRCFDDQRVDEVMQQMSDAKIRRVPVIEHETGRLIGIVSLGDLAAKHSAGVDHTLENISSPARPDRAPLH